MKYRVKTIESIFNLPIKAKDGEEFRNVIYDETHKHFLNHKEWWGRIQDSKYTNSCLGNFYDFEIEEQWEE